MASALCQLLIFGLFLGPERNPIFTEARIGRYVDRELEFARKPAEGCVRGSVRGAELITRGTKGGFLQALPHGMVNRRTLLAGSLFGSLGDSPRGSPCGSSTGLPEGRFGVTNAVVKQSQVPASGQTSDATVARSPHPRAVAPHRMEALRARQHLRSHPGARRPTRGSFRCMLLRLSIAEARTGSLRPRAGVVAKPAEG